MQKEGIGRPSTFATFIPTLLKREYIEILKDKKGEYLKATEKGIKAIDFLTKDNDTWIITSEFTKQMENTLDKITESKATYLDFIKQLHSKMNNFIPNKIEKKPPTQPQIEFAKKLATANNIELPKGALDSMKECCDFIEKYNRPSQKQVEFAKKIASDLNIKLPKDLESNSKVCMEFIANNKDKAFKSKKGA